jgi:hypothetical protein
MLKLVALALAVTMLQYENAEGKIYQCLVSDLK